MGTVAATTKIKNIRENLNEPVTDAELIVGTAGTDWTNTALLEHLNKAKDRAWDIVRLVRENYFLVTGQSLSLTASVKSYSLAAAARSIAAMRCTTAGYEHLQFRQIDMASQEWKDREAEPAPGDASIRELGYNVIGTGTLLFCDYPPAALTVTYDSINYLSDYTLASNSTSDIPDEWREFEEAYATMLALRKKPEDKRLVFWQNEVNRLTPILQKSVSKRQIRDPKYVEEFSG